MQTEVQFLKLSTLMLYYVFEIEKKYIAYLYQ